MSRSTDVLIIGGGVAGVSIARELSKYELDVVLIEKEADVGWGQTKASYAICHPGARWAHGTLAQRMMVESHRIWDQLVEDLDIELARIGELVLAFNEGELQYVDTLKKQGEYNGIKGLEILDGSEVRRLEPHVNPAVLAALRMPTGGVFNPFEVVYAFFENARANGVKMLLGTEVTGIIPQKGDFIVETNGGEIRTKYVVNAAGLYAEKIAQMAGADTFKISHETKSTCLILDRCLGDLVQHVVTGVADPKAFSRFKVVMPTFHRNLLLYTPIPEPSRGIEDRAIEKRAMDLTLQSTKSLVPDIDFETHMIASFSGLTARNSRGDFIIEASEKCPGFVNVALPPPGITCSPAIGKQAAEVLRKAGLPLVEKDDFNPFRRKMKRIRDSSMIEIRELVHRDPRYGRTVCRCEKVSEAEIVEAIHRGATTLDGIKFRTRAGMGRCQSNFCGPEVAAILAGELRRPYEKVTKKGLGSAYILNKKVLRTYGH
ncbi:MAG: NAD(P)/FAD-dependent oxidoreductase [Deltaproteobacteria bacterium]|nr:NAD(P)/FAD-dependent oxidoreductase [Deltaproteobacteria bacterium]